jgi:hypothetical protein
MEPVLSLHHRRENAPRRRIGTKNIFKLISQFAVGHPRTSGHFDHVLDDVVQRLLPDVASSSARRERLASQAQLLDCQS